MRKIEIDFGTRTTIWRKLGWGAICLAVLAWIAIGWIYATVTKRTEEAWTSLLGMPAPIKLGGGERSLTKFSEDAREQPYLSDMANSLALPWDVLFAGIESAAGDDVALLGLQVDPGKVAVRIFAEARGLSDMFEYLRCIEDERILEKSFLSNYQVQMNDPTRPVRFEVSALWPRRPIDKVNSKPSLQSCQQESIR